MTKNRSNRGRNRRNRDRPVDGEAPEFAAPSESTESREAPPVVESTGRPSQASEQAHPPRQGEQRRGPRPGAAASAPRQRPTQTDQPEPGQRSGPPRPNRRRQPRRHQMPPTSTEVLKPRAAAAVANVRVPVYKRKLEDIAGPEGPVLGCPMLTRTHLGLPVAGGRQAPRCSLAWAIHSETEASYCMETPDLVQCWKVHPERLEEIRARLEEQSAAD